MNLRISLSPLPDGTGDRPATGSHAVITRGPSCLGLQADLPARQHSKWEWETSHIYQRSWALPGLFRELRPLGRTLEFNTPGGRASHCVFRFSVQNHTGSPQVSEPGHLDITEGRAEVSHTNTFPPGLKNTHVPRRGLGTIGKSTFQRELQVSSFCESAGLFTD